MRLIDEIFEMGGGYVLDFSNRSFAEFFEDEFGIDIYSGKYDARGTSKANHLRSLIELEDGYFVGQVLRKLWAYRGDMRGPQHIGTQEDMRDQEKLFGLIQKIEAGTRAPVTTSLSGAAGILNLDTVSRDLQRALDSAKTDPEDAVTAACSTVESVCRSILVELGEPLPAKKDIKGLFNAVKKPLGLSPDRTDIDPQITDDVRKVLGGLATVIEGVGALRTHGGDAHGRERGYTRIDQRIASLAIHAASTAALFLIETWQRKFPSRELPRAVEE
ncbi:abortive infection family protein [Methyloligella solikamskensis]